MQYMSWYGYVPSRCYLCFPYEFAYRKDQTKPLIQGLDVGVFFSSLLDKEISYTLRMSPSLVSAGYRYDVSIVEAITEQDYNLIKGTLGNMKDVSLKELKLTGGIDTKILVVYSVRDCIYFRMSIKSV